MLTQLTFIKVFVLSAIVIFAWYTNTQAQVVEQGLIHYWTFDKTHIIDEEVGDSVGENIGTIIGKPNLVSGKIGDALEFDGNAGNYVSFAPVGALANHSFTIQAWVNVILHAYNIALSQGDAKSANRYLHLGTHKDTHAFMFRFYGDDQDGGTLKLNEWYHLVGAYDRDKKESLLYVNGEFVANKAVCEGLKADPANSDLEIGANYGRLGRGDWFHGIIDEVGIYDRVLTADEVKKNYNAEKGLILSVDPARKVSLTWGRVKTLN